MGDKNTLCKICGRNFLRPLDLARHQKAPSNKHLISSSPCKEYNFSCSQCNLYFTIDDHLQLHRASIHGEGVAPSTEIACREVDAKEENAIDNMVSDSGDLMRHGTQAAIQYEHSDHQSEEFKYKCQSCSLWLMSEAHLNYHCEKSSCIPSAQHEASLALSNPAEEADLPQPPPTPTQQGKSTPLRSSPRVAKALTPSSGKPLSIEPVSGTKSSPASANVVTMKRSLTINELKESRGNSKRTRALYVEDRKAFYSVISLLVDPVRARDVILRMNHGEPCDDPKQVQLFISENIGECVDPSNRPLIEKLKEILLYETQC